MAHYESTLDAWYPVAGADDLNENQVSRAILFNAETVLWRNLDNQVNALENRCAHRGLRLSKGFVRNGNICCGYHRWQYNQDGRCTYVPADPDLSPPKAIAVPRRSVCERNELIWLTGAEANPATESFQKLDSLGRSVFCRSTYIGAGCQAVCQRLLAAEFLELPGSVEDVRESVANTRFNVTAIAPSLLLFRSEDNDFVVALQPCSDDKTGMHFLALRKDDKTDLTKCKMRVVKTAVSLRRLLEDHFLTAEANQI